MDISQSIKASHNLWQDERCPYCGRKVIQTDDYDLRDRFYVDRFAIDTPYFNICTNFGAGTPLFMEKGELRAGILADEQINLGCIIFRTDNVKFFCITVLLLFSPFLRQNKRDGPQRQSN